MTLKYESEILFDLMKRDGDDAPSDVLPYESELKEKYLNQVVGAYPKLQDYRSEWLNYNLNAHLPAEFPVKTLSNVTEATVDNVVPYAYGSAILKGSTKYRDIDTGEVLDAFEDGRNLELVSVKMPVLMTTGKNLCDTSKYIHGGVSENTMIFSKDKYRSYYMKCKPSTTYIISVENSNNRFGVASSHLFSEDTAFKLNKYLSTSSSDVTGKTLQHTFTTTEKDKYLYVYVANNGVFNPNIRVQVEEGSVATSYEPHKSNILTVNEDVTLRGIGDVRDTLDCLTGEVTERIAEVVLDGSEDWAVERQKTNTSVFRHAIIDMKGIQNHVICDCLPTGKDGDVEKIVNERGIDGETIFIALLNSKADNLEKLKSYLSQNPITIQYILQTESVKTVDLTVTDQDGNIESIIRPIEGTMQVSTSSQTLPPLLDMSVPIEATSQNLMSFANIVEGE